MKHRFSSVIIFLIIFTFLQAFCGMKKAHAQPLPAVIGREQERLQQEQQRLMEEEFRRKELEDALRRPPAEPGTPEKKPGVSEETPSKTCAQINKILYDGNHKIPNKKIDTVTAKYIGKCLSVEEINLLLQEITNLYLDQGYVTSRAFMLMPQKRIKEGTLELKIIEGKVDAIDGVTKSEAFTAFPQMIGEILDLRDIEQGLEQINRLSSNSATMAITAGEKDGESVIMIENKKGPPRRLSAFGDNAGSESTGRWRIGARGSYDNLLGLNDALNLSYTYAPYRNYKTRHANAVTLGLSIPLGYFTFSDQFSYSNYRTSFVLSNGERFYSYGDSIQESLLLDYLLLRSQSYKISFGGGLTYKRNNNYTAVMDLKTKNEVSSRSLVLMNLEMPMTFYTGFGVVYLKPGVVRGLKIFGALNDDTHNYGQKAQYTAAKLYGYYSKPLPFGFALQSSIDGQYTKDELFGSEAFYIGGEYTVRGVKDDSIQGDRGIVLRNDVTFAISQVFPSAPAALKGVQPGVFIDAGYTAPNNSALKSGTLVGAGFGISYNYKIVNASFSYAHILKKPAYINEKDAVYFSAGLNARF